MTEEERYAIIKQQMQEISDRAATYNNPAIGLLSAQLYAEMHARNERHHGRVVEARAELIEVLRARVENLMNTLED